MVDTKKSKAPKKKKSAASSKSAKEVQMCLPAVLDIAAAEKFHGQLKDVVSGAKGARVVFDAKEVERITTPCVQLLVAAASGNKGGIAVANPSDVFSQTLTDLGFVDQLNEWNEGNE